METDRILHFVYEQLKNLYPLQLSSSLELEGFRQEFLVLHGISVLGPFDVYHDGALFIFEVNYSPTEPYPHWHPKTAEDMIEDIKNLMEGKKELLECLDD